MTLSPVVADASLRIEYEAAPPDSHWDAVAVRHIAG
jgi:hypothetical protein